MTQRSHTLKPKLAIAAGLCVALLIPLLISHQNADPVNENEAYYAVDPEMLETMEMLAVIGELSGV